MAVWPNLYAGMRATADLLTSMQSMHAAKASSTSRASTTTISADPDLQLPVEANAQYLLEGYWRFSGAAAAGIDIQITVPTGTTGSYSDSGRLAAAQVDSGTRTSTRLTFGVETTFSTPSTSAAQVLIPSGRVIVGSTAGTLSIDWAQNVSNATATVMEADSWIRLSRIS